METDHLINDDKALKFSPSLSVSRVQEKVVLNTLNGRFMTFIDQVKAIVERNRYLEERTEQLEKTDPSPNITEDSYHNKFRKYQQQLERASAEKAAKVLELNRCCRQLDHYHKRVVREIEDRDDADQRSASLRRDVGDATLKINQLENTVQLLKKELELSRRSCVEEIETLTEKLSSRKESKPSSCESVESWNYPKELEEVRKSYQRLTSNKSLHVDRRNRAKIEQMEEGLKRKREQNKQEKSELEQLKRQLSLSLAEAERLSTRNKLLNYQMNEAEVRCTKEIESCKETVKSLQEKLAAVRSEEHRQSLAHSKALSDKISLDLEIEAYRQLIESENGRLQVDDHLMASLENRDFGMKLQYYSINYIETDSDDGKASDFSNPIAETIYPHEGTVVALEHHHADCETKNRYQSETWSVEAVEIYSSDDDSLFSKGEDFHNNYRYG